MNSHVSMIQVHRGWLVMNNYQRVSIWALFHFIGRTLALFLKQAVNLIPLAVVVITGGEQIRMIIMWVLAIGLPGLIVLHAGVSWWFFRYCADANTLHIREGIFKRTQLTLDYDRIQQADIRQPWYFRPFGQSVLGVESAGSDGKEVELAGLSLDQSEKLRQTMMLHKQEQQCRAGIEQNDSEVWPDGSPQPDLKVDLPLPEIARYGLIHNPVLLVLPVVAYPIGQLDLIDDWLVPRVEGLVATFTNGSSFIETVLMSSAAVLVLLVLIVVFSVLLSIVRYYGFTLTVHGQRYQTRAGLLSIVSRSFQYARLQRLVLQQGIIARLLDRKSLRIDQSGRPDAIQQTKSFFVPVLDASRESELATSLKLNKPDWQSVHPASMVMPWLISTTILVVMTGLIADWNSLWMSVSGTLAGALTGLLVWAGWRRRAVHIDEQWLAVRRGVIGQQQSWIPAHKMQTLRIRQGPWLRLWGVSALHVLSAGGRETIAWLPVEQIEALKSRLTQCTEDYQGRWM
ncbi:MAG: hypothetical protein CMK70_11300 [Pseudohongiella sp.]|nr:hypothetical protein [Pseudohongiella sp.]